MRALVLSGGGAKGSFQVGVLRGMLIKNPNLDYQIYTGISVGALNTSQLASGKLNETLPILEDVWLKKIKGNSNIWKHKLFPRLFISLVFILISLVISIIMIGLSLYIYFILFILLFLISLFSPYLVLKYTKSVYDTSPLKKLLKQTFPLDNLLNSDKILIIGAVNYQDGKYYSVDKYSKNIFDWVLASSAFPVFFPMQKIEGCDYTDGGVREIAPVRNAIELGATQIDIILADRSDTKGKTEVGDVLEQTMHFLDIMSSEVVENDIKTCQSGLIEIRVIMPEKRVFENSLNFDPVKIKENYEHGIEIGKNLE